MEQQRKRLPIYKHRLQILHAVPLARCKTSQESIKKGTELRIYPGSCWCFHHHFQDLPGFQLLWPYLGGFLFTYYVDNMSRLMICRWKNHQKRRIYQTNMGRTGALTKWNWLAKGVHQLAVCDHVKTFDWSDCDPSRRLPLAAFGNQCFSYAEHESYLNWWWINHQHPLNPYYDI